MAIQIRAYTPEDHLACHGIFCSNIPVYFTPGEEPLYLRWLDGLDGVLPPEDGDDETHYFVLELDGKVRGCGGWGVRKDEDHATLIWGAVHKDFHKQGLGAALTDFRIRDFQRVHPGMDMTIDTSHHTAAFYERYGFRTEKFIENGYADGLHRHDMRLAGRERLIG